MKESESNIKTIKIKNRTFLVPYLSAFEQKDIFFKIYHVASFEALRGGQQGFEFDDHVLFRVLTSKALENVSEIEETLLKGVRERKESKNLLVDIEFFHNEIHKTYMPLLIEILKINLMDFFCSLKEDVSKVISLIDA